MGDSKRESGRKRVTVRERERVGERVGGERWWQ